MSPHAIQPDRPAPRPRPELLAPAGDWAALRAATAAGADAVYFGLENFNARRRAANFSLAELPEVVAFLHHHNMKGYVTLNTLVFCDELAEVARLVAGVAHAGADAVIVQDLGLIRLIRRMVPTLPIHASTQTTQTEPAGITFLRELGVTRIILARELSLGEIAQISRSTNVELEVFVHGALCISYSGQCLASESLFGRSGNRGLCAQVCRLPFQLEIDGPALAPCDRQAHTPAANAPRDFPLSPRDLAAYDRIADLVDLGVAGFKIEGRLKNAAYVGAVVGLYRAAIDAALAHRPFTPSREQQLDLAQSFSRGFSPGFLDGVNHALLVDGRSPKARGVLVGRVVGKSRQGVMVEFTDSAGSDASPPRAPTRSPVELPVKAGDGVVFESRRANQPEQGGRIFSVTPEPLPPTRTRRSESASQTPVRGRQSVPPPPERGHRSVPRMPVRGPLRAELRFGRDLNIGAIELGSRIWKTDDPAVRRRIERAPRRAIVVHRTPLYFVVRAVAGAPLELSATDATGLMARVVSDDTLAAADKHPLTTDLLREQLDRLGDTPFELAAVALFGPDGPATSANVMAPKSVLNDLRRRAVTQLLELRAAASRHAIAEPSALESLRAEFEPARLRNARSLNDSEESAAPPQLHVLVRNNRQLEAVLTWTPPPLAISLSTVYVEFPDSAQQAAAIREIQSAKRVAGVALPRILMPGEVVLPAQLANAPPDAFLVRNLGTLSRIRALCPQAATIGDFSLNIANDLAAALLFDDSANMVRLCPAHDLNWQQLSALARHVPPERLEIVVHQHMPLFHTRHCLFAAHLSSGADCTNCCRPCADHDLHLRDRIGVSHPVRADTAGRNTVFNARPQTAAQYVPAMLQLGLRHFRVEFLEESANEARALLDVYAALLCGESDANTTLDRLRPFCPTGITPGTFAHA